ncbi:16S rRNA (cytosine(1402)-N(4))-methyltransferase RsmH [Salinibius halmophilus]|uniref:16S rRNA (cytosine(1402)-N(4))-methyltransferase RsmH n=1 Tax=Salinibius halmophilus TaxID=1853216 RepID=UPI000E6732B2|nr:16S rRNA (cytosine(1402)-N(4))-methyltransferase RsmH [Salinibius halmophilus]
MSTFNHKTVLLDEAVELLVTNPDGVYVDGTFGRGGHSRLILSQLSEQGRLFVFDKDPEAIAIANALASEDPRVTVCHCGFIELQQALAEQGVGSIDGLLLDLGVSSPQLDDASRGFSFRQDGPLDMRMNPDAGISAAQWVNEADEAEMVDVFFTYGEEKFSRKIAGKIVEARQLEPFRNTLQLANLVAQSIPRKFHEKNKHPATRIFQAIRIRVNNELGELETILADSLEMLSPGGRQVIISFHSLEDRMVKQFMRKEAKGKELPRGLPVTGDAQGVRVKLIGKARKASQIEIEENVRARSAIMRVAEKL